MSHVFSASVFVIADNGAVLLIHHLFHKMWLPPGGRLEAGEMPLEAARRELIEETSLSDIIFPKMRGEPHGTPPGFLGYEEHPGKDGMHLNFCFVARIAAPTAIHNIGPDDEWDRYDWFLSDRSGRWRGLGSGQLADPIPANVRDILLYLDECMANGSQSRREFP